MTPQELTSLCQIASGGSVLLTLPGPPPKRGYFMRLCKRRGPLGDIVCTKANGESVVRFKALAVLRFLEKEAAAERQGNL